MFCDLNLLKEQTQKKRGSRVLIANEKNKISMHCILASLYFLMLPLTISTNSTSASFLKIATIPIAAYFVISFVFYKKEFNINMVHIALALYTMTTVIAVFVDPWEYTIKMVIGYFLNTALYICLSVISYNETEIKVFEYVQVILLIMVTILALSSDETHNDRNTLVIFGQQSDPNYFVGFFILPLVVTLKKIFESRFRIIYVIVVFMSFYAIMRSGSRGGALAVIVTIIAFSLIYPEKIKTKMTVLACFLGFMVVAWLVFSPMLSENIIERMTVEAVVESKGTNRADIWASMINEIKNSSWEVIFGRGIEAKHTVFLAGKEYAEVAHNHILQVMYDQGIIGLIVFIFLISSCFMRCIRKRKYISIAIIGMLALSISLTFNPSTKAFWNLIPYAAFVFPKEKEEISQINEKGE